MTVLKRKISIGRKRGFLKRGLPVLALMILALPFAVLGVQPLPNVSGLVSQADDYYLGRWRIENVKKGLALLHEDVARDPRDYEGWWRIAEFTSYLARHTDGPEEMKELEDGIEAGKRATALAPDRPEGHFWLGADYGLYAEEQGLIQGLRLVDSIRHEMQIVEKLDPDYDQCGAQRILARVDYRAPFFKGGDKRQSVALLEGCLKRYPTDSLTMLYLAESLIALGRRADARAELEKILALCPDPLYGPEQEQNQADARELLTKEFGEK